MSIQPEAFVPLTRQMYSDTTWSGDTFVNEAIEAIPSAIEYIAGMTPENRGNSLGHVVLKLRHMLLQHNDNPLVAASEQWREEYDQVAFSIDSHIAYCAKKQQCGLKVSWQDAARMILVYAQENHMVDVYTEAIGSDDPPELAVGIDFVEGVMSKILD